MAKASGDEAANPALKRRARAIAKRLGGIYPDSHCALHFRDAYELLVATVLSAQCTDVRVNQVTPALFARYPDANALATALTGELEALIRPTGFFRAKARHLLGLAAAIVARHGGAVPADLEALTALPGVGRKTAHVVLGNAFDVASGVVVDTHVKRLAFRLGLTESTDPERIEHDLDRLLPKKDWVLFSHLLIDHGRRVCDARRPRCEDCGIAGLCPKRGVAPRMEKKAATGGKAKSKGA